MDGAAAVYLGRRQFTLLSRRAFNVSIGDCDRCGGGRYPADVLVASGAACLFIRRCSGWQSREDVGDVIFAYEVFYDELVRLES